MKLITLPILLNCGFDKEATKYLDWYNELLPYYSINTLPRLAHHFGQVLVESDRGKAESEYASGIAYEGRLDLGNTKPGYGVKYKGRGAIEVTGFYNYDAFGKKFGIDCVNDPELLEEPKWWVVSGLWYWDTRRINRIADQNDVLGCSQLVNQGSLPKPGTIRKRLPNHYAERVKFTNRCKIALSPLFA